MHLNDALRARTNETPDAVALSFNGAETSFADLTASIEAIASHLCSDLGVERGDRVAYMGLNHDCMVRLVFACAEIGAIFCPYNSRLAKAEYVYLLGDSEPKVVFYDHAFCNMANELSTSAPEFHSIDTLTKLPNKTTQDRLALPGDPLLLVYTSGTTGKPKGVVLTQQAVWANIENGQKLYNFQNGQRVLITLPLFHVGGMCILLLPALTHGSRIDLHQRFDPAHTIRSLDEDDITTTILVPAQMAAMMKLPQWETAQFNSMNYLVVGSSVIPLPQIQAWHKRGIPVSQIYGATETGPSAIGLRIPDCMKREGAAGTPMPLCEIDVRDKDGHSLNKDEAGDIWVKGPNVMQGYWRNQAETDAVLVDGWYNTGDIGKRDCDGFYWIIDRSKDVIISGGENIYPAEVEGASLDHPSIAAIAVVGKPDPHWGETPVAVIELKASQALSEQEYLDFLQSRLARYKQPKTVMFMKALPRNGMGKVEKPVLREMVRQENK